MLSALKDFGAPLQGLTAIDGVEFDLAWEGRLQTKFAGAPVGVLSKKHLIQNKRATGRTRDLADVEWLERH